MMCFCECLCNRTLLYPLATLPCLILGFHGYVNAQVIGSILVLWFALQMINSYEIFTALSMVYPAASSTQRSVHEAEKWRTNS